MDALRSRGRRGPCAKAPSAGERRGNGFIADTQKSDESARREATRDRSLRGKDCAHAPTSPPLRAIFPLELFASRQFDLVQAILRPSRPQSAPSFVLAPELMEAAGR